MTSFKPKEGEMNQNVLHTVAMLESEEDVRRLLYVFEQGGIRGYAAGYSGGCWDIEVSEYYLQEAYQLLALGAHGTRLSGPILRMLSDTERALWLAIAEVSPRSSDEPPELPSEFEEAIAELEQARATVEKVCKKLSRFRRAADELPDSLPDQPGFREADPGLFPRHVELGPVWG